MEYDRQQRAVWLITGLQGTCFPQLRFVMISQGAASVL